MSMTWRTEKLGELCDIQLGKTPARSDSSCWDPKRESGNVWLSIADLLDAENNIVFDSKEYISNKGARISRVVKKGTLMVSFKLTLGRLAFAGRDLYTNEAIAALTIRDESKISKKYLFYFLRYFDWIKEAQNDVKLKGMALNKAKLKEIVVRFPSLSEQERIVAALDEVFVGVDAATANSEKNLVNARELFEAYRSSVLGRRNGNWVQKKLGDLCDFLNGFAFKSVDSVRASNVQLVRMGNLYGNVLNLERKPSFYPDNFAEKHSRFVLGEGDLIMSLTGTVDKEDYGYTVEVPASKRVLLLNQRIAKFVNLAESEIDRRFLLHYLRSRLFLKQLYRTARGVRQANLSTKSIKLLPIELPDIDEQRNIAVALDDMQSDIDVLADIYSRKLVALSELKRSLLQRAFSGELTAEQAEEEAQEAVA